MLRYSTRTLFFCHLLSGIVRLCNIILLVRLFEVKLTKMSFVVEKNPICYVVVEFIKEKTLAIVPSIWLKEGQSYWPPYNTDTKNRSACRRKDVPGSNWSLFPVKEWARTGILC